jgi:hypothetical protein
VYEEQDREAGNHARAADRIINANRSRAMAVARHIISNHSRAVAGGRG